METNGQRNNSNCNGRESTCARELHTDTERGRESEQRCAVATMCSVTGVCVWGPVWPAVSLSLSLSCALCICIAAGQTTVGVGAACALASLPTPQPLKSRLFIEIENEASQRADGGNEHFAAAAAAAAVLLHSVLCALHQNKILKSCVWITFNSFFFFLFASVTHAK